MEINKLIELSISLAKDYRLESRNSLAKNFHQTKIHNSDNITQIQIDAILVDFINFMDLINGGDANLSIHDLRTKSS